MIKHIQSLINTLEPYQIHEKIKSCTRFYDKYHVLYNQQNTIVFLQGFRKNSESWNVAEEGKKISV